MTFMKKRAAVLGMVALGLVLVIGGALWAHRRSAQPPFLRAEGAKGYAELVRAVSLVAVLPSQAEMDKMNLALFVKTNEPALDAVRSALKYRVEAPPETYDFRTVGIALNNYGSVKALGHMLRLEGRHFEEQQEIGKAAASYLEIVELGQNVEHGPLICLLIGIALESLGLQNLERIEPNLDGKMRLEIAAQLERLNGRRLPMHEVIQRERYVTLKNSPSPFHYFFFVQKSRPAVENAERKHQAIVQQARNLAVRLRAPGQMLESNPRTGQPK